jgi:hypothetical protein
VPSGQVDASGSLVEPYFAWQRGAGITLHQQADVLYVFDSCYASQIALGEGPELLAAANWASGAGDALRTSFTNVLADQLEKLGGKPQSVAQIFSLVHHNALVNEVDSPPIHIAHPSKESIILAKQEKQPERRSERLNSLKLDTLQGSETRVLISVRIQADFGIHDLHEWEQWLKKNIPPSINASQITVHA